MSTEGNQTEYPNDRKLLSSHQIEAKRLEERAQFCASCHTQRENLKQEVTNLRQVLGKNEGQLEKVLGEGNNSSSRLIQGEYVKGSENEKDETVVIQTIPDVLSVYQEYRDEMKEINTSEDFEDFLTKKWESASKELKSQKIEKKENSESASNIEKAKDFVKEKGKNVLSFFKSKKVEDSELKNFWDAIGRPEGVAENFDALDVAVKAKIEALSKSFTSDSVATYKKKVEGLDLTSEEGREALINLLEGVSDGFKNTEFERAYVKYLEGGGAPKSFDEWLEEDRQKKTGIGGMIDNVMVMLRKNGLFSMVKSFFSEDGSFMDKAMGLFSGEDEEKEEFKSDLQQKNEEELVGIKEKVKVREKDEFVDSNWDKWKKGFEGKIDIKGFFGVSNGQESVDVGAKGKLKSNFDSKADVETFLEKLNNVNNKYMNWGWDFENVLQVVNKEGGVKFEDGKVKVKVDGEIKGFEKDDQDDFEKEMKKEEVLKELQAYKDFKDNNAKFGCEFKDLPDEVFVDVGTKGQFNEKFKGVLKSDFVEGLDKEGIKKYFRKLEKIGSSDEMDMPESDLEEILDMNKSEWKEVSWLNPKKYWRTFNTMRKIDPKDSIDLGNWLRGTKGTKGKAFWESQYSTLREWIWKSNNK